MQAPQRELADDAQAQHRGRTAQREAGPDRRPEAVAGDAGQGGFLAVEVRRQLPQPAALVADGQQFVPRRGCPG